MRAEYIGRAPGRGAEGTGNCSSRYENRALSSFGPQLRCKWSVGDRFGSADRLNGGPRTAVDAARRVLGDWGTVPARDF